MKMATRLAPHRRVLLWMCILVAVNQFGFGAMIPVLPLFAQSFGVSTSAVGMAVAVYGLARFASAIPASRISDGFGRRHSLAFGGLVSVVGSVWCAYASGFTEFLLARFVAGFGAGIVLTTGQIVLADIATPEHRARTIATYQATFLLSVWIGPYPGGLLSEHYGLASPFVANAVLCLFVTALAWFAVAETRGWQAGAQRPASATRAPSSSTMTQARTMLANRGFVLVSVVSFMNAVARTGGLFAVIPILATSSIGLKASEFGLALLLSGIAGFFATYPAGWLADKRGRKWVIVPAVLTIAASMVLFGWSTSFATFLGACMVWTIAISVGGSAPAAYAVDCAPPGMNAAAVGLYRMIADAGYVVGPVALGVMADRFGPAVALDVTAVFVAVTGLIFAALAPETRPRA